MFIFMVSSLGMEGEGKRRKHLQAVGLRVRYSINFTSQSSGTTDIQETKCSATGKHAAIPLHLAKNCSIHSYSLGGKFSEAVMLRET